jgi:hypothetical protein
MANNLFISYDLITPGQNYDKVIEAIKSLGSWARVHKSFWYVNSEHSEKEAADHIWKVMDRNDKLIVVNASSNLAYWYNLDSVVSEFLQKQWF